MPTGGYLENEAGRPTDPGARLRGFRERLHASFRRRADALFEHTDAILMSGPIPSLPHLSLAASQELVQSLRGTWQGSDRGASAQRTAVVPASR
ncbi:MAG: hypothetical protein K0S10_2768 [Rubrobacteraceae bacterium]|nr:hypothetical protein [Rubrobacteraceae bacterium]